MTKIKICGITNLEDALLACQLGADALGFVFAESPRKVDVETVADIVEKLPPLVSKVGVFVNEKPENIEDIAERCSLDYYQLHGDETPKYVARFPQDKIIKAFRIKDKSDLDKIDKFPNVSAVLLDSFTEGEYGGTGKTFDWKLALGVKGLCNHLILSGGMTPENVAEAIKKVKPYGVDVSSGVEEKPGKKDPEKLEKFFSEVRK